MSDAQLLAIILRSGDPEMELAKKGDNWEILLPFQARASETAVEGLFPSVQA